ncbi:hypothetical protein KFL_002170070 [Klebsormidium nitens]|uniref:Uncharacterized protein n=1 Tax=Klebsormidium nitens TaxID=105231 RepID=A0A1Y1I3F1_KLENI|nr:hypothetical protein KFL_002170070 [Klebsormidium nitens]|eukprot:GAQ85013.1 hypothetical protein KFL_002170070 [Klebsormidium nitens]
MRGSSLPLGTLRLISQRRSAGSGFSHSVINEITDPSFPSPNSGPINCGKASSSDYELDHSPHNHTAASANRCSGLRRWYTSDAAGSSGRGRRRDPSPGFPQRRGGSLGRGASGEAVDVGQAAKGQFEDPESERKGKPMEGSSILQQILAASAKENEEAAKRAEARSGAQGSAEASGRNGAGARLGPRPPNNNMQDLMRMFQPKNGPFSSDTPDPDGRLFRPRRSPEPPTSSSSSGPPMLRDEIDSIPPAQREVITIGYGERAAMQKEDRVIYRGGTPAGAGRGGARGGDNRRRPLTLSEIFSRSKTEGEEKAEPSVKVQYKRNVSQGRGRSAASSEFQQRVLGLPPDEDSEPTEERRGQRRAERPSLGESRTSNRRQRADDEEDERPPLYGEFAISNKMPQDKPRKENKPNRSAEERAQYEAREAEREEKELEETAKETELEIENSEWYEIMKQGWEPQPDELGVPQTPEVALRDHLAMTLEPEYHMESFGVLPDLDDTPQSPLEDALTACKQELMEMSGIEDEDTWQAMLKRTLDRTSELEAVVKRYNKSAHVSAAQQHRILGDIIGEMPERGSPSRTPEMVAHVTRALQTLEHNCRWPLDRKKAVMTSLIAQLGKYDGSNKQSKLMQSVFG